MEMIQKMHPQLVLVDIRMPGMDGVELIRRTREQKLDTQFMIISGYSDFAYAQKALKYGALGYILKPIDQEELLDFLLKIKEKIFTSAAEEKEKQELQSVFFEKKCAAYQHFPVETYLAEQLFTILKYLELIPSMEVYDTTFRLLKQETVDGRHIYETLSFFCEKEEVIPQEKRIEMLESYDTYTYMKKRWEKYVRKQGMENVSWETVLHRIVLFLRPVWNAMCRDEVFFGDWMPDLERYL